MLVDEIERLERQNVDFQSYRDRFHAVDKKASIYEERLTKVRASEIISASCLTVGSAALGYAPSVWDSPPSGYLSLAFGSVIVICGVWSRWVQR